MQSNKHSKSYTCLESLSDLYLKKAQLINKADIQKSDDFKKKAADYLKQALEMVEIYFSKNSYHAIRIQEKLKNLSSNKT